MLGAGHIWQLVVGGGNTPLPCYTGRLRVLGLQLLLRMRACLQPACQPRAILQLVAAMAETPVKGKRWQPLEANPDVLNNFAKGLGVDQAQPFSFTDVLGLDQVCAACRACYVAVEGATMAGICA